MNEPLTAFDNPTMTQIESIIRAVSDEAVSRRIIVDTPARPLSVTIPDADTIPASQRAARKFEAFDAFHAWINSSINDYKIVGVWTN